MTPEAIFEDDRSDLPTTQSRWRENHGNLLMAFVGLILLVGSGVLLYRQNRFVPPRFPDAEMIVIPDEGLGAAEQEDRSKEMVTLRVRGAVNDYGTIKIAVYGSADTFNQPDKAVATHSVPLREGEAVWAVPVTDLPPRIAVACYHDENEDEQLTLNRFGIPAERYGFSRNARGLTGPPSFQQAVIDRPAGGETLDLFIR